jgi:hypothetical protein
MNPPAITETRRKRRSRVTRSRVEAGRTRSGPHGPRSILRSMSCGFLQDRGRV